MSKFKILILAVILIILTVVVYNYNQLSPEPLDNNNQQANITGPKISVTPESFDLGTVIYGDVPEKIITIKNVGNESLEVLRLSTSCGCTEATIAEEDKIIAPGKSVEMLVTFDPAVHKDDTDLGELTRIIYLKTNDSLNPEVEVELQANVIKPE